MEKKEEFQTASSIPVKGVYPPSDLEGIGFDYTSAIGLPTFLPPSGVRQSP